MLTLLLAVTIGQGMFGTPPAPAVDRTAAIIDRMATDRHDTQVALDKLTDLVTKMQAPAQAVDTGAIADAVAQRMTAQLSQVNQRLDAQTAQTQAALARLAQSMDALAQAQTAMFAAQRVQPVAAPPVRRTRPISVERPHLDSEQEARGRGKFWAYDANGHGWWGDTQVEVDAYAASIPRKVQAYTVAAPAVRYVQAYATADGATACSRGSCSQ